MVVLRTLRVPFDMGTGPCCGADAPHPTSFMLFACILINAIFTAGAFLILVPPPTHPDAGALLGASGPSPCAGSNSLAAIPVPEEP